MSLSEIAIRRPVFAWMLMAALILFGAISFTRMGVSQMPDVDFPVINIGLSLPNAAPEVMENDVVDAVEDAVMGIEGIRNVSSRSSLGKADVTVEFDLGRNVDVALQEVQVRIAQAAKRLPLQLEPPVITKSNPEDQPIMWVLLTADEGVSAYDQMLYARNILKDRFSTVAGVGTIQFAGFVEPNLRVYLSASKLRDADLTADDVTAAIASEQLELPAGRVENPSKEFNVRLLGEAETPEDFGKIRILTRAGAPNYRPLNIGAVSRIEEGLADVRAIARFNGKAAVGLGIVKQRGSNAVEVSKLVHERAELARQSLPKGFHLEVSMDSTKFIRESVSELNFTLILAALLTSVVCYLFLASWSSTINVLFAIPTSIIGAFMALYFFRFTLNTFTLLGLSLAIGIVVDDAIMMLENIIRHREMGSGRIQAAIDGAKEITFAAIAATIAIGAIFMPVIFMKGVVGRFFYQFGITVTAAVFLSLLEALTLTPMRCSQMGGDEANAAGHGAGHAQSRLAKYMDELMDDLAGRYQLLLRQALARKQDVLKAAFGFFAFSLLILWPIGKELMPNQDQSQFVVNLRAPVGTSIQATDEIFTKAEADLKSLPEVADVLSTVGGYQGQDIVNAGTIIVSLKEPHERKLSQLQLMNQVRDRLKQLLPETEVFLQDLSLTAFSASRGYPIEFTVQGPEWDKLFELSQKIMAHMRESGLAIDVNSDVQGPTPEIRILPDRDAAAAHGVSIAAMGDAVGTLVGGRIFSSATQFPKAGHRYDIRVRSEKDEHGEPFDILKIMLHNNRGANTELVPIGKVVRLEKTESLALVTRMNRARSIPIYANVPKGRSQQAVLRALEKYAQENLPTGYRAIITGSAKTFYESFEGLLFALGLGIIVAYMVLASQFDSFIHPIAVLMALPFSLSGAMVALFVSFQSLNLFSMIGLILLMGITKKNSILLVDFTNARREEGLGPDEALLAACPVRLRPILMTSIATVAGAIPAAISFGPGSETRVPMAIAIIGGVVVSTLLTLIVVPCAYSVLARWEKKDTVGKEVDLLGLEGAKA